MGFFKKTNGTVKINALLKEAEVSVHIAKQNSNQSLIRKHSKVSR